MNSTVLLENQRHLVSDLDPVARKLVSRAMEVRRRAYAPYSNYLVGCAVLDRLGKIHTGCNVENASYSLALCAERVAIFKMVSRGQREFEKLVLVTSSESPTFPCGACLQVLQEFGPRALVIAIDREGFRYRQADLPALYPAAFWKEQLKDV
jgi:cytidine deaminase